MRAVLAAAMLLAIPLATSAGEVGYTSEQALKFLAQSLDLGAERGICIGTAMQCSSTQALAVPETFDLMVTFELNSDQLSEAAKANLLEFSKALADPRLGAISLSIEGHTDATGPAFYNQRLSERRADAVVAFLRQHGADPSRFVVKGFGDANPRSDDPFDPANRRVETRIIQ